MSAEALELMPVAAADTPRMASESRLRRASTSAPTPVAAWCIAPLTARSLKLWSAWVGLLGDVCAVDGSDPQGCTLTAVAGVTVGAPCAAAGPSAPWPFSDDVLTARRTASAFLGAGPASGAASCSAPARGVSGTRVPPPVVERELPSDCRRPDPAVAPRAYGFPPSGATGGTNLLPRAPLPSRAPPGSASPSVRAASRTADALEP